MSEEKTLDERIKELIKPLTQLQKRFVHNLVKGSTQRQAYVDAKGTAKTDASRDACASDMLSNPKVSAYYDALMEKAQLDSVMTKAEALQILSRNARVKITDVCDFKNVQIGVDEKGDPVFQTRWVVKNAEDMDPEIAACIKSVSVGQGGVLKVEMHDSHGAIKQLSTMLAWDAPKRTELTGADGGAIEVKEVKDLTDDELLAIAGGGE